MKKLISSSREKRIFILSCLSLMLFIFYRGVFIPLSQTNETLQDKILVLEKNLYKTQHAISENQPFEEDYQEALNCFKQTKTDKELISSISNELENLAQDKHLEIKASPAIKSKSNSTNNNFSISLSINGSLNSILDFLNTIQNCPNLFSVNEMILEKKSPTDSKVQCRLLLTKTLIK